MMDDFTIICVITYMAKRLKAEKKADPNGYRIIKEKRQTSI